MEPENDQIEIVLCTHQGEIFLEEQLDSLLSQTYKNCNIRIYDDCSTDNTVALIKQFMKKSEKISYVRNSKKLGFLKNYEQGLTMSSAQYVALCDQDDIWMPEKLAITMKHMKELEKKHPDTPLLVHSDLTLIDTQGEVLHPSFFGYKGIHLLNSPSLGAIIGHCGVMGNTVLINRKLVNISLPFPDLVKFHDYWLALVNEISGVRKTISQPLVKYRIHEGNTSSNNTILMTNRRVGGNLLQRNFLLPFIGNREAKVYDDMLERYPNIENENKRILKGFSAYLRNEQGRLRSYLFLLLNGFLKKRLKNRVLVFLKLMLVDRKSLK